MMRNQVYFSLHVLNLKLPAKFHLMRQITLTVMYGDLDVMKFWKYDERVVLFWLVLRELCYVFHSRSFYATVTFGGIRVV